MLALPTIHENNHISSSSHTADGACPTVPNMASFVGELWESVFTPGTTPTLLIATNVTFAALQAILAALLYVTFSIHFLILSVISAGLWTAINWFARELKEHQLQEEEKARRAQSAIPPPVTSDDSETEVEGTVSTASLNRGRQTAPRPPPTAPDATVASSHEVEPIETHGELKHRTAPAEAHSQSNSTKSSASTEDEWEKVSENEKDK